MTIPWPRRTRSIGGPGRLKKCTSSICSRSSNVSGSACGVVKPGSLLIGSITPTCVPFRRSRTSRNLEWMISYYATSCRISTSASDTSHRHFGSLLSDSPAVLPDRSCTSLVSFRTFKTSSSTTLSSGTKKRIHSTQRPIPCPHPHCEGG
ncbi:hypothetical protein BJ322DRAFT_1095441 [Thelephora terrestris]|uniref:Uncharacterized protein n=1 Tax=Thelephora terrestris TaxID=56493 RepID=A0A9P6H2X5_9AGAM|nr:hypothetical protein BJ322DRAFT_1095441 [Thelephora terrestris]